MEKERFQIEIENKLESLIKRALDVDIDILMSVKDALNRGILVFDYQQSFFVDLCKMQHLDSTLGLLLIEVLVEEAHKESEKYLQGKIQQEEMEQRLRWLSFYYTLISTVMKK